MKSWFLRYGLIVVFFFFFWQTRVLSHGLTPRLCLFWLKRISGNHFTPAWVFGKHKKLGQTKINFHVDHKIPLQSRKWFSIKIFTSNHFRTHAQRERERERATFDFAGEPRAQITPSTSPICESIYEPINRSSTQNLRPTDLRTHEPIFDLEPSTHKPSTSPATQSLRTTNPRTDLSLSLSDFDFLCDFDRPTNRSMFLCDFDFLLSLFDLWFFCCCCGGVGGGVLVVFLLCGGGFCVGGDGK